MIETYVKILPSEVKVSAKQFIQRVNPDAVFHSPRIFKIFSQTRGHLPALFVKYHKGEITALMLVVIIRSYPLGVIGRRALIMQAPVYSNKPADVTELLNAFKAKYGKSVFFTEMRNVNKNALVDDILTSQGFKSQKRINLIINFGSADTFKQLSESKQRQVNKGLESGVCIEPFSSIDEVKTFYGILNSLYKRKVKKPLPHRSFFISAYRFSKNDESTHMLAIKYESLIIGGILLAGTKGNTFYEWYIGGLHNEFKELYPSVLATWGGIEKAQEFEASKFDFMGGGVPGTPYGVREFKARFGSEEVINYRWRLTYYPLLLKFLSRIFKILKF